MSVTANPFLASVRDGDQTFHFSATDRLHALENFTLEQCRAALAIKPLQKSVKKALERRVRKLELVATKNDKARQEGFVRQFASAAATDIINERRRQVSDKDYSLEHDDEHVCDELAAFAAFYAMPQAVRDWPAVETGCGKTWGEAIVPPDWFMPACGGDRRRELVKAGALILAEIERLDRQGAKVVRACRVCCCTQDRACMPNSCYWVEIDLCSECFKRASA